MKKKSLLIVVVLFNCSCGAGIGDNIEKISGSYTYVSEGSMASISSSNLFIDRIYPIVTGYAFNEEYILVEQEPSKNSYRSLIAHELESKYNIMTTTDSTSKELAVGQYDFFKRELLTKKGLYKALEEGLSSDYKDSAILYIPDSLLKNSPYKKNFSKEEELLDYKS